MITHIQTTRNARILWNSCIIHTQRSSNKLASSHAPISLSLYQTQLFNKAIRFHFSAAQPQTLEKINNYENLVSRINSSDNIADVIKIYTENEDIYKCEHLSQTARSFARLSIKGKTEYEVFKDPVYVKFTEKISKSLSKFNETDLVFWVRKYKMAKTPLGQMDGKVIELVDKIMEYVKRDQYKFKQLSTIYFDVSHLGRNGDEVCSKIIAELNRDASQLTPFTCINLLSSISLKQGMNSGRELILIDLLCKLLPNIYDQLDINQKTLIFKCISNVEPFIHPPKYKMPNIMFTIKNDLKEQVDSLSEQSVLNVLQGYKQIIYSHFPQDLLEEIKEMVVVTVKHHPKNMKSAFLLEFLEIITILNKKRKTETAKMNILINELTKRIKENDETLIVHRLDRLINYCDKYLKSQGSLIIELSKNYESRIKNSYSQPLMDLISKKAPLEAFDSLLEAYFGNGSINERKALLKNLSKFHQVRLCISLYNHRDRHEELFQLLNKQVEELIESDPLAVIASQKFNNNHNAYKRDIIFKSVTKYIQVCQNDSDGQIARAMISSFDLKEIRNLWFSTYFKNKTLDTQIVHKFVEQFFAQDNYDNQERFLFFVHFLALAKPYPIKLLVSLIKDNTKFLQDITKYDSIFQCYKQNPEQIRLINIYQICLRLESFNMRLDHFYRFMSQVFDICVSQDNKKSALREQTSYISFLYQIKLAENNVLKVQHAKIAFENVSIVDIYQKGKFLSLIAKTDPAYFTSQKDQYDIYFQHLLSNLNSRQTTSVLNSIASILRMPQQYLKSEHSFVVKTLKEHINSTSDQCYSNVFTAIPFRSGDLYSVITKEVTSHFPQIQKRLAFPEIRRILQKWILMLLIKSNFKTLQINHKRIVDLDIRDHQLLSSILQEIGSNFYTMSCEDRVLCLSAFCQLRIRQDDLIEKCLRVFIDNMINYRCYYLQIITSIFKVGYHSEILTDFLLKSMKYWRLSSQEYLITLSLIAITKSRQKELLEEIQYKLQNPTSYLDSKVKIINLSQFTLCTLYYSQFHQQYPEILKFLEKYHTTTEKITYPAKFIITHNAYLTLQKYLVAMGVEYKTNYPIDNYEIPLCIPSSKQIIKVNSNTNLNFDRKTLDGKSIMEGLILDSIPEYEVITTNLTEFMSYGNDQLAKINFLIKKGIKCESTGVYDFSKFQAPANEEPTQTEDGNSQQEDQSEDLAVPEDEDLLNTAEIEDTNIAKKNQPFDE